MNVQYSLIGDSLFLPGLQVAVQSILDYGHSDRIVVYSPDPVVLADQFLHRSGCRLVEVNAIGSGYRAYGRFFPSIVSSKVFSFESLYPDNDYVIYMDADVLLIKDFGPVLEKIESMARQVYAVGMIFRIDGTGEEVNAGLLINSGVLAIPAEYATPEYVRRLASNVLSSKSCWEEKAISEVYDGLVNVQLFAAMHRLQESTINHCTQWVHYSDPKPWIDEKEGRKTCPRWWSVYDSIISGPSSSLRSGGITLTNN